MLIQSFKKKSMNGKSIGNFKLPVIYLKSFKCFLNQFSTFMS
jgi:hypothetical protein